MVPQLTLTKAAGRPVFAVSALETNWGTFRSEDFWFIVAVRSEDEAEIRAGQSAPDQVLKDIRRQTRRHYSAEGKIHIVLEGLRGRRTSPNYAVAMESPPRCITEAAATAPNGDSFFRFAVPPKADIKFLTAYVF